MHAKRHLNSHLWCVSMHVRFCCVWKSSRFAFQKLQDSKAEHRATMALHVLCCSCAYVCMPLHGSLLDLLFFSSNLCICAVVFCVLHIPSSSIFTPFRQPFCVITQLMCHDVFLGCSVSNVTSCRFLSLGMLRFARLPVRTSPSSSSSHTRCLLLPTRKHLPLVAVFSQ